MMSGTDSMLNDDDLRSKGSEISIYLYICWWIVQKVNSLFFFRTLDILGGSVSYASHMHPRRKIQIHILLNAR